MPAKTMPHAGAMSSIFPTAAASTSGVAIFLSVAMTTPFFAQMPRLVRPVATALSAYSIWSSLPDRENVVSE